MSRTQRKGYGYGIQALKAQGVVRHIGMSSHTPSVAQTALDTGLVDMLTFSINPGYDYHCGDYAKGSSDEREVLYRRCEKDGVGISVVNYPPPLGGG